MPSLQTVLKFATSLFAVVRMHRLLLQLDEILVPMLEDSYLAMNQLLMIVWADFYQAPISDLTVRTNSRNIAAFSWGPDRLDIVGIGGYHNILHQGWDNASDISGGTGWTDLGGHSHSPPAIVSPRPGLLLVFLIDTDGILSWKYYERSSWYPGELEFYYLGGLFSGAPVAVSWDSNGVDLFARHHNNSYLHNPLRKDQGWLGWENLGGNFVSEPAAAAWGPGRLDIFGQGIDGSYYWKYWNGTTWSSSWESLGGEFVIAPLVVSKALDRLTIFGISRDGNLFSKYFQNGAWSSRWEYHGGSLTTNVAVQTSSIDRNRYDIFGIDTDNNLSHQAWNGTSGTPWVKHFGPFVSAPIVTSWSSNRFEVFSVNYNGRVLHQARTEGSWLPAISQGDNLGGLFIDLDDIDWNIVSEAFECLNEGNV